MNETENTIPCPYKSLPPSSFWRRSVSRVAPDDIDPVLKTKFIISEQDRVATAGSCFAQNIARYMQRSGFNYFVTEPGHSVLSPDIRKAFNFGTFSARYGNIYTTRQLLQLLQRAYGERTPVDDIWCDDGRFYDPFRPFIQPDGFDSEESFYADRERHFSAIRQIVEQSDVFVFTLGLTEAWENTTDGSVYAICPGCGAGQHRPTAHRFRNFSVTEVADDLRAAIAFMVDKNPNLRVLSTVSPVPLIATYEDAHVLTATTYSKSVLRVAAQMVADSSETVDYFPSYEIITGNFSKGAYFGPDLRDVEERGVEHAMSCFFKHYTSQTLERNEAPLGTPEPSIGASERINNLICDEEALDN